MTEALSRRERYLLAQIEQDLRADDAELDRRLTTMRWNAPPPPAPPTPHPPPRRDGCLAVRALGAVARGVLIPAATASATALVSACASVSGLALACLLRLVCRRSRLRSPDDR
ncbi:DUF3040 domain-containing protein [Streptomyces sp. RS10V-4]|uniref:DUF3040 domain-containing protein n=1 Tax=Streptomyces rhizoryzae TaxID=2932493 RepID=UPI002004003F|nr:DUF3040 domain-containing protein [Streptomyces rhizoryzae]MCK7626582.1 DUF3040 domain-containing protein [Streptomyces rhizoryzae]